VDACHSEIRWRNRSNLCRLEILLDDEAMELLLDDARRVPDALNALEGVDHFLMYFLRVLLAERPFDVLECVAYPARGTDNHVVGLRARRDLHLNIAARAKHRLYEHDSDLSMDGAGNAGMRH